MSAGREGVFFCASEDGGKTWQEPVYISRNFASERGHFWNCPTGYTCIKEIAPGEILVIYDDIDETKKYPDPNDPSVTTTYPGCHNVIAKRYKVEAK